MKKWMSLSMCTLFILGMVIMGFSADKKGSFDAVKTFASKCAMCHGKDAKGNAKMAKKEVTLEMLDLVDSTTLAKADKDLNDITSKGLGKMPSFAKKFKAEEINQIITYIRTLKK